MARYIVKTRFSVAANALIFNDRNEILLCHRRDQDKWNFPGGAMEANETPEEAAVREAQEEIGVQVEIIQLLGVYTKTYADDIVFAFLCKITNGTPTASNEADQIKYFPVENLPANMSPVQMERVNDAVQKQKKILFKKQTGPNVVN